MGYNAVLLYTEDTYEVAGRPYFGYLRGRFSQAELRELDQYADALGIEMIPCIQTLGHMARALRWPCMEDVRDTDDVLLLDEEKTYALIEEMIVSASRPFATRRIHIGMDEPTGWGAANTWTGTAMCPERADAEASGADRRYPQKARPAPGPDVHSLRHTAASLMISGGADVATVSGLLGHSQVSTTLDIYTHAFDEKKREVSARCRGGWGCKTDSSN